MTVYLVEQLIALTGLVLQVHVELVIHIITFVFMSLFSFIEPV